MSHSNNPNDSKGLSLIGERDYLNEAKRLSERAIKAIFLMIVPASVLFGILFCIFLQKRLVDYLSFCIFAKDILLP